MRPAQSFARCRAAGTYADLAIEPSGQLALIDPRPPMVKDYSFVSLESITYRRSASASVRTPQAGPQRGWRSGFS